MSKVQMNKDHIFIDTNERIERFYAARAFGCEDSYYEYRKNWNEYPQKGIVPEYPLSLEINISNVCNLKCPFCYREQDNYIQPKQKFMSFSFFKKIIDDIGNNIIALRFNSPGETILNPDFIKMVKYAKEKGAIEISFITNSGALSANLFEKCLLAGVDWITISVDGVYDVYEKNRFPLKFEKTYNRLKKYKEIKEYYEIPKPVINVQTVWSYIENNPQEYVDLMSKVSDCVNYNAYIDFSNINTFNSDIMDKQYRCGQPFQRMLIGIDGDVKICCGSHFLDKEFSMGNIQNEKIYDIWHSEKYKEIRNLCHTPGGYMQLAACRKCASPHLTFYENHIINGVECSIKKYRF